MNAQTPGPLHVSRHRVSYSIRATDDEGAFDVANTGLLNVDDSTSAANAHLLAAAYSAFDRAGRELGIDASTLAESIDLAEVIRYALDYSQINTTAQDSHNVGRPDQTAAARASLAGLRALLACRSV